MIVVVLNEPQDLVNIAHVVRGMKNFGLRDLRLVNPGEFESHRVEGIAHQTQDVLARVRTFQTLDAAIGDCVHVVGFTARGRTAKRNLQRPREAAVEVNALAAGGPEPVALLFGREDRGLSNEALDLCHRIVTIPSDPNYSSLNLAHAVIIMLYELALARGAEAQPFKTPRRPSFSSIIWRRIASHRIQSISTAKSGSHVTRFGIWMSLFQECCAPSGESVTPLGVPTITNSAPQYRS